MLWLSILLECSSGLAEIGSTTEIKHRLKKVCCVPTRDEGWLRTAIGKAAKNGDYQKKTEVEEKRVGLTTSGIGRMVDLKWLERLGETISHQHN